MLMLHCGAKAVTREELREIPVIRPEKVSDRWKGTQHGEWVDALSRSLEGFGLKVEEERFGVAGPNDEDLFGVFIMKAPQSFQDIPGGLAPAFGIRHSNRCLHAHIVVVGGRVFVCDNGVVAGEYVIKRKHTSGVNINEMAQLAVNTWAMRANNLAIVTNQLRAVEIDEPKLNRFVVGLGEDTSAGWSRVGSILKEWREPRHEVWTEERNGWGLYNAVTEIGKCYKPGRQLQLLGEARDLILNLN